MEFAAEFCVRFRRRKRARGDSPSTSFPSCLDKLPHTFLNFHHSLAQTHTRIQLFPVEGKEIRGEIICTCHFFCCLSTCRKKSSRFPSVHLLQMLGVFSPSTLQADPPGERLIRASLPLSASLLCSDRSVTTSPSSLLALTHTDTISVSGAAGLMKINTKSVCLTRPHRQSLFFSVCLPALSLSLSVSL